MLLYTVSSAQLKDVLEEPLSQNQIQICATQARSQGEEKINKQNLSQKKQNCEERISCKENY